jgi:hypothetical protein
MAAAVPHLFSQAVDELGFERREAGDGAPK